MITYGTLDIATLPAYNQAVFEQIPNAELHMFEGAEFPDEFNAVTLDFLARHPL